MSPFIFIIFGATGDLAHKKLMPALYRLYQSSTIGRDMFIVGVGRREIDVSVFKDDMMKAVQASVGASFSLDSWGEFADGINYVQGFFEDPVLYDKIASQLSHYDTAMKACVARFFYLATPPEHYETILNHLESSKLSEGCLPAETVAKVGKQGTSQFTRLLIEKPFGKDLTTARHLDKMLASIFDERQIYRIDHYLGKETVQNILALRFGNGIFEPTWNHQFIDHVQITLAEESGIGTRGQFYEGVGALRDVVQNHMLQMLAVTAMEQPKGFSADSVRMARVAAMKSITCIGTNQVAQRVVRGQYAGSHEPEIVGYRQEKNIDPKSNTETYVALKLFVDTPRWRGVPFYLRTGKRLASNTTEISLHYKKPVCPDDICLFNPEHALRNVLTIVVQPDEGIRLRLMAKEPGFGMDLSPVFMGFHFKDEFSSSAPEAYERLLLDVIRGDQMLFASTAEIDASWQVVTKIFQGWAKNKVPLHPYIAGSWGPSQADALLARDGRRWTTHQDRTRE